LVKTEKEKLSECPCCDDKPANWVVHVLVECPTLITKYGKLKCDTLTGDELDRTKNMLALQDQAAIEEMGTRMKYWKERL